MGVKRVKICFEGIDGCGKSTQVRLLVEHLQSRGLSVAVVKHPGYTAFGAELRKLLLGGVQASVDLASRLVFLADYVETTAALPKADVIIMDRHPRYSNYAYGIAMGTPAEAILALDRALEGFIALPDITIVLDVEAETAWERMLARGKLTVIEERGLEYFRRARFCYLNSVMVFPEVVVVPGDKEPEEIHRLVLRHLEDVRVGEELPGSYRALKEFMLEQYKEAIKMGW
jgi:dTMP kinase